MTTPGKTAWSAAAIMSVGVVGREDEIEGDKYSDESGNDPGSDLSDDELTRQNLSFLRTTCSRRNISIIKKYDV